MEKSKVSIKKISLVLAILLFIVVALSFSYYIFFKKDNGRVKQAVESVKKATTVTQTRPEPKLVPKQVAIKDTTLLNVPYTVQAPFANWKVHEESCEESAALMYHYFLEGQTVFGGVDVIPPQLVADEMLKMKAWQVKNYGKEPDLSIEKLGVFVNQYYGYQYKVYKNVTPEDIKREISAGHPILVPVMTHNLKNPHYGPKSVYHVLVIKGYNANGVITNDAGVKEGQGYPYTWDILFSAIDAQTPKMGQGREMVVMTK